MQNVRDLLVGSNNCSFVLLLHCLLNGQIFLGWLVTSNNTTAIVNATTVMLCHLRKQGMEKVQKLRANLLDANLSLSRGHATDGCRKLLVSMCSRDLTDSICYSTV